MPWVRDKQTGQTFWVDAQQPPPNPEFPYKGPKAAADVANTTTNTARTAAELPYVAPRARAELRGADADALKKEAELAEFHREREEKERKFGESRASAEEALLSTIGKMDEVYADSRDNGGLGETGFLGNMLSNLQGTAAYDLSKDINTIQSNVAFDRLQRMRDMSPTGGALGQVAIRELEMLKNSVGSIDQGQSQESFEKNIKQARQRYLETLKQVNPAAANAMQISPEKAAQIEAQARAQLEKRIANLPPRAQQVGREKFENDRRITPLRRRAIKAPRKQSRVIDFNDLP